MTNISTRSDIPITASHDTGEPDDPRPLASLAVKIAVVALVALALVAVAIALLRDDDGGEGQASDVSGQGGNEPPLATEGARLVRRADGVSVTIEIPTPVPGTYEYPTGDMVQPWADPHPRVSPGAADAPEVFTVWLIAFNRPDECTDGECDVDDISSDAPARGGAFQLDGRVADGDTLTFTGNIRLGQDARDGAALENPEAAEVHIAIAPHGRALDGAEGWRQLNGPVGNPTFWWSAAFPA